LTAERKIRGGGASQYPKMVATTSNLGLLASDLVLPHAASALPRCTSRTPRALFKEFQAIDSLSFAIIPSVYRRRTFARHDRDLHKLSAGAGDLPQIRDILHSVNTRNSSTFAAVPRRGKGMAVESHVEGSLAA